MEARSTGDNVALLGRLRESFPGGRGHFIWLCWIHKSLVGEGEAEAHWASMNQALSSSRWKSLWEHRSGGQWPCKSGMWPRYSQCMEGAGTEWQVRIPVILSPCAVKGALPRMPSAAHSAGYWPVTAEMDTDGRAVGSPGVRWTLLCRWEGGLGSEQITSSLRASSFFSHMHLTGPQAPVNQGLIVSPPLSAGWGLLPWGPQSPFIPESPRGL